MAMAEVGVCTSIHHTGLFLLFLQSRLYNPFNCLADFNMQRYLGKKSSTHVSVLCVTEVRLDTCTQLIHGVVVNKGMHFALQNG